jgi:uncharacterized glyoxalase superfamily protein PhnB
MAVSQATADMMRREPTSPCEAKAYGRLTAMIRQIAPQFFTTDLPSTLSYYKDKLGFACLGTWQDPPVYAIVARDQHRIHFRCAAAPAPHPDKYAEELLDAYVFVEDADALFAEYGARGVEFARGLADTPWDSREFVVKDCDGRLLAFGASSS